MVPAVAKKVYGTGDDLIAGTDVERHESDDNGVRARRDADAELATE
jgi:hypothetical protein